MAKKDENNNVVEIEVKGDSDTLAILKAEEKVPIMLPITENMEPQMVVINGCIYAVPRGQLVEVPKSIFEVIQKAQLKLMKAKSEIKITSQNA